jgi:hypothetical protein
MSARRVFFLSKMPKFIYIPDKLPSIIIRSRAENGQTRQTAHETGIFAVYGQALPPPFDGPRTAPGGRSRLEWQGIMTLGTYPRGNRWNRGKYAFRIFSQAGRGMAILM